MTKMPSRPKLISLASTTEPGEFQMLTPLPRSLICSSWRPSIRLWRTIAAFGPFQVDADQVALEPIVLDHGAGGAGGHEDAAVLDGEVAAGAGDRQPAHHHLRRVDGDHAPGPAAVEYRARPRPRASRRGRRRSAPRGGRPPARGDPRAPRRRAPPRARPARQRPRPSPQPRSPLPRAGRRARRSQRIARGGMCVRRRSARPASAPSSPCAWRGRTTGNSTSRPRAGRR